MRSSAFVLVVFLSACATVVYPGPRRPRSEVARVIGSSAVIERVDGVDVNGMVIEVLPGMHVLLIRGKWSRHYPGVTQEITSPIMKVCLMAKPNRAYEARADLSGETWTTFVVDSETGQRFDAACPSRAAKPSGQPVDTKADPFDASGR